jgi:hypothetical protein
MRMSYIQCECGGSSFCSFSVSFLCCILDLNALAAFELVKLSQLNLVTDNSRSLGSCLAIQPGRRALPQKPASKSKSNVEASSQSELPQEDSLGRRQSHRSFFFRDAVIA